MKMNKNWTPSVQLSSDSKIHRKSISSKYVDSLIISIAWSLKFSKLRTKIAEANIRA